MAKKKVEVLKATIYVDGKKYGPGKQVSIDEKDAAYLETQRYVKVVKSSGKKEDDDTGGDTGGEKTEGKSEGKGD